MAETEFNPVPFFKALGCRARYEIFEILLKNQLCVGAIADRLGVSQPSVSQHLKVLKHAGIVEDCRCGYHVHYTVNKELIRQTAEFLTTIEVKTQGENPCTKVPGGCAGKNANTLTD